jgi:hypothetical protein
VERVPAAEREGRVQAEESRGDTVALVAGSEVEVKVPKPGMSLVKFVGGPLDGHERYIMDSMRKFAPQGAPQRGEYRRISSDPLVWQWKEAK